MKVKEFLGINNVADRTRLAPGEFTVATNVDVGARGNLYTRPARTRVTTGVAGSVRKWGSEVLALLNNDLVAINAAGTVQRTIYNTLGYTRVWYAELPDGRMAFSNGLINGLISPGGVAVPWGISTPVDTGSGLAGGTRYQITYVRTSDGLEGPPAYSPDRIDTTQSIVGLPVLAGHTINVYFAPYGEQAFYAGSTATDTFIQTAPQMGAQFIGNGLSAPPVGTQLTAWRSRILIADGKVLWATRPMQPELCDMTADFIQMPDPITLVHGVNSGVFVGTTNGVYFLAGETFGALTMVQIATGPATLGSLVVIDATELKAEAQPKGSAYAALCIVNGVITMLAESGSITPLTADTYKVDVAEVHATTRQRNGFVQYIAAPV